ncbi:DEAD/DEAH box helicase family protein [Halobacillus sp. BAB-2008]|uniref:DEAD/DEAH box helicase family protein n=1 Tax=Halobacillus sp. BAB-2008 TaxID=1246484 RepID=UPI0002A4FEEB|nr:DEAD/DEAH box helicase family protein [Halobacillus sp. BAB-2008]ELK47219.1 P-loop containing nucleoside triphosphate hydrolase [Halobacillus sp. BAB-2008]
MVDFGKLLGDENQNSPIKPKEIFESNVRSNQFPYLRSDQEKILQEWFEKRDLKDNIVKMNTGGGKTAVGLLQLQSSLNENLGPALYLCLDKLLVEQVLGDAEDLGIDCVTFEDRNFPEEFLNSEAILVTTFAKLFNAKTVFGVEGDGSKDVINIGSVIIDDAHAALNKAREVFSLSFDNQSDIYQKLVPMFKDSLVAQSRGTALDVLEGRDSYGVLMVPYWAWIDRINEITTLLSEHSDDESLKFKWPLVRDFLEHYFVYISSHRIELSPKCLPIQKLPSFHRAQRRIFMSATLNDDSSLIKDFQVNKETVEDPIESDTYSDIGERMIIAPQNIDKNLKPFDIAGAFSKLKNYNVVTLVSSDNRASLWQDNFFNKPAPSEISQIINNLKESIGHKVVLSNRYDGVDLPGDSCRILIIDDLPSATTLHEQYSLYARPDSRLMRMNQAQKIEQGFGRSVRSVNDYSVVIILGKDLVSIISTNEFQRHLSPQTVTQINLGTQVAALASRESGSSMKQLGETIKQVLDRDPEWIKLHRQRITSSGSPEKDISLIDVAIKEREAFDLACSNQSIRAADTIRQFINTKESFVKDDQAWFLQLSASYLYNGDKSRSMEVQLAAHTKNTFLLKPPSGINYKKLTSKQTRQALKIKQFISSFTEANSIVLHVTKLLDDIAFKPDSSTLFERSFTRLGECLGFDTQQPEAEFNNGCDILWNIYDDEFLVIEAKNEVKTERDLIYKSESEQISSSDNWFKKHYPDKNGTPVLIHPSNKLHHEAFTPSNTGIINEKGLGELKENVNGFFTTLAQREPHLWTPEEILGILKTYMLERRQLSTYLTPVEEK